MIEWIPIEEFAPVNYEAYLICYRASEFGSEIASTTVHFEGSDKFLYGGAKVTHAAKLHLPSEMPNLPASKANEDLKTAIKEVMVEFTNLVTQGIAGAIGKEGRNEPI